MTVMTVCPYREYEQQIHYNGLLYGSWVFGGGPGPKGLPGQTLE